MIHQFQHPVGDASLGSESHDLPIPASCQDASPTGCRLWGISCFLPKDTSRMGCENHFILPMLIANSHAGLADLPELESYIDSCQHYGALNRMA